MQDHGSRLRAPLKLFDHRFAQRFLILFLGATLFIVASDPIMHTVAAQATPTLGVWAPEYHSHVANDPALPVGGTVRVDLNITDSPALGAFDVKVIYDFDVFEFLEADITTGTVFGESGLIVKLQIVPPELRIAGASVTGSWPGGSGTLVHVDFTILRKGVSPIGLYETILSSAQGQIEHTTIDGYFTNDPVEQGPVVDFSFHPGQPVKGQEVTFDATATLDPDNATGPAKGVRKYRWFFGSNDGSGFVVEEPLVTRTLGGELSPKSGVFWVRLIAEDFGDNEGLVSKKVVVIEGTVVFDFKLSLNPVDEMLSQGSRTTATVTATLLAGTPEKVSFRASNIPVGVRVVFSPPLCNLSCGTIMRILVTPIAEPGTSVIVIFGTSAGETRVIGFTLTILPA